MKPLYLLLIFYALFITAFADALELAFTAVIPGFGIMIGMPLAICINITMGSGLVFLLAQNGMFHPKFGPAGIIASLMPGIGSLPIWIGLVIAGILQKTAEEKTGIMGTLAKAASSTSSFSASNPVSAVKSARTITQAPQSQPHAANDNSETKQRVPLNLKSPRMNDIKPYAPKAA
jgi:hypothetical protein